MSEQTPPESDSSGDAGPGLWARPVVRGAVNGIVFAALLCIIQVLGLFRPAQPLDDDTVSANILAGVVFGFAMYVIELWRRQRRLKSGGAERRDAVEEAARREVERRLQPKDQDDRDAPR